MADQKTVGAIISETTVPASTLTPEPPASRAAPPPRKDVSIEIPPVTAAAEDVFVAKLAVIVNAVYAEAEAGIFREGYQRTTAQGVADLIRAGQLAVAYLHHHHHHHHHQPKDPTPDSREPIGCVCIKKLDDEDSRGEFGMLALDAAHRGGGLGRDLALFAERRCRDELGVATVRLELLVPSSFEHAFKVRLQGWYERMGYEVVALRDFGLDYPHLQELLAGPTEYRVFEKRLV